MVPLVVVAQLTDGRNSVGLRDAPEEQRDVLCLNEAKAVADNVLLGLGLRTLSWFGCPQRSAVGSGAPVDLIRVDDKEAAWNLLQLVGGTGCG
jgi:hypothetical protein